MRLGALIMMFGFGLLAFGGLALDFQYERSKDQRVVQMEALTKAAPGAAAAQGVVAAGRDPYRLLDGDVG